MDATLFFGKRRSTHTHTHPREMQFDQSLFLYRHPIRIDFIYLMLEKLVYKSVFGSVVAGTFQIIFRAKMHANDVFLFFKNHF